MELKELPQLLKNLIKGSKKTQMTVAREVGIGHATLSRILTGQQALSKSMAKRFNEYFEVAIFYPYKIDKDNNFVPNFVNKNNKANQFNFGDVVLCLLNKNTYNISEIKFNKEKQEWMYLLDNQWVEEFYLKEVTLKELTTNTLEESTDTFNDTKEEKEEMKIVPEPLFEIPQIKITPEESITNSIEKIDDKDSIKTILKDVMVRLINLL